MDQSLFTMDLIDGFRIFGIARRSIIAAAALPTRLLSPYRGGGAGKAA
jgi:hypothetical protein